MLHVLESRTMLQFDLLPNKVDLKVAWLNTPNGCAVSSQML